MRRIYLTLVLVILAASSNSYAATVTFNPNPDTVSLGQTFNLDIIGLNFLVITDGGGVNFTFDQNIVQVNSVSIDTGVWDFGPTGISEGTIDNVAGTVTGIAVNAISDVGPGNFIVATVEFVAFGLGSTDLILTEFSPENPFASGGNLINPSFSNGFVTVTAVPLPAAVWLFISGIGILSLIKKSKLVK